MTRGTHNRDLALELMLDFAERTGVVSGAPPERYLWTDAFAVCNLLGLGRVELALGLVEQVHRVLGQHRADDPREGWLSGLPEQEAADDPTRGGLRIGKKLPERRASEPLDERLEWERDGQYFHYLTKWIQALDRLARTTGEARYNAWARQLADTAHQRFVYAHPSAPAGRRMYWKMSIDLSRPLVDSMGQHDPLDGYVICLQLQATAAAFPGGSAGPDLSGAIIDFASMLPEHAATPDPLGLGGLLSDAWRLEQLRREGASVPEDLIARLLEAAAGGLGSYSESPELRRPADYRLAFRELGLVIGLAALERFDRAALKRLDGPLSEALARFLPLRDELEAFWLKEENRRASSWLEHRDINEVMLATALAPDGYLSLGRLPGGR